jgi:energy-coupling factor transporter transmembrane protein EcfT
MKRTVAKIVWYGFWVAMGVYGLAFMVLVFANSPTMGFLLSLAIAVALAVSWAYQNKD